MLGLVLLIVQAQQKLAAQDAWGFSLASLAAFSGSAQVPHPGKMCASAGCTRCMVNMITFGVLGNFFSFFCTSIPFLQDVLR